MTSVHQEIMRLYAPDGIFTNRWSGNGMCYCEHCVKTFREYSGLALPRTVDPQDPARHAYIFWNQKVLFDLWRLWNVKIREINPNASYLANAGGGAFERSGYGDDRGNLLRRCSRTGRGRSGVMPPWMNGKNGKEYRATMGSKAIVGIFSVGVEEKYRWKDSVQSGGRDTAMGGGWDCAGIAAMVYEVQCEGDRRALAARGGRDLQVALRE